MRNFIRFTVLGAVLAGSPLLAESTAPAQPPAQPAVFQAVVDCKAIADATQRLACYDKAVAALASAAAAKDVLVVDKATVRSTKQGLFGLALPKIKLFGSNDDAEIDRLESTIASTYEAKDGFSVFVLPDGARWKQTDGRYLFPKAGQPIVIHKAALGSFMANVNKQSGVRVVRLPQADK